MSGYCERCNTGLAPWHELRCHICGDWLRHSPQKKRRPKRPATTIFTKNNQNEPNAVYVDASFADGLAGLAVVGALGCHSKRVPAASSTEAERLALLWAVKIARQRGLTGMVFRTDNEGSTRVQIPQRLESVVEWVPRHRNCEADDLAKRARIVA